MARFSAVALLAATVAYTATASSLDLSDIDCPDGWSASSFGNDDKYYCCPGSSHIMNDDGYCCLGSSNNVVGSGFSTGADGSFTLTDAFNDNSALTRVKRLDIPEPSCAATVDYKDPDYSSKVSSLAKSLDTTSTQGSDNKPASTSATTTGSNAKATGSDNDSTGSDNAASSTSSDNAGAMPTAEILGGVMAMAAAFAL